MGALADGEMLNSRSPAGMSSIRFLLGGLSTRSYVDSCSV